MPTPGSGVLDEILDVTKESLTESNSPNLTSKGTTLTGSSRSPKQQSTSAANTSQAADSAEGEGEARLLHKLDLLTSLVQDMVPVVKTLQESHDAWLLQDVDDVDAPSLAESENEEGPPPKRPRITPQPDEQPRSKTTDTTGKVDSLVTEVTEDEVTGPAISEKKKSQTFLTTSSPVVLMIKPLSGEKRTFIGPQTAHYLPKLVSIPRFGTSLKSQHEAWMLDVKLCKTP